MHFVYIILSLKTKQFYVGETYEFNQRLEYHNDLSKNKGSTKTGIPWQLYHLITCVNKPQALKVERHIKNMKSRVYIGSG